MRMTRHKERYIVWKMLASCSSVSSPYPADTLSNQQDLFRYNNHSPSSILPISVILRCFVCCSYKMLGFFVIGDATFISTANCNIRITAIIIMYIRVKFTPPPMIKFVPYQYPVKRLQCLWVNLSFLYQGAVNLDQSLWSFDGKRIHSASSMPVQ